MGVKHLKDTKLLRFMPSKKKRTFFFQEQCDQINFLIMATLAVSSFEQMFLYFFIDENQVNINYPFLRHLLHYYPYNNNAKEIYPCDQGKQHRNSSAHVALIARIDFLSIIVSQFRCIPNSIKALRDGQLKNGIV